MKLPVAFSPNVLFLDVDGVPVTLDLDSLESHTWADPDAEQPALFPRSVMAQRGRKITEDEFRVLVLRVHARATSPTGAERDPEEDAAFDALRAIHLAQQQAKAPPGKLIFGTRAWGEEYARRFNAEVLRRAAERGEGPAPEPKDPGSKA